jgi:glycolate oxidase FAD binding subunit
VKLRPLPDDERFVTVTFEGIKDAALAVRAITTSDVIPTAIERLDADAARGVGLAGGASLIVGFDGLPEQVEWQCAELGRLAAGFGGREPRTLAPDLGPRLATAARDAFDTPASVMRFVVLPTQVGDTMEQAASAARARGFVSAWTAHAGVGVVTGALAATGEPRDVGPLAAVVAEWREIAHGNGGYASLEWAPLALKAAVPVWDDAGAAARIMKRIKEQVDPKNLLNPGRFVGGI